MSTCICLIAAPEGLARLEEAYGDNDKVHLVLASLDEKLDENSYIVPGLGDAGDRLYGVAHGPVAFGPWRPFPLP